MHFLFAWRYFKAKKSTNAINIIAWVSIIAIIFGTTVLILILSVFNGLEGLVKSLYSSFYTDLKVSPSSGKVIKVTAAQLEKLRGLSGIKNYSLVVEEKALVQNGENQSLIYLKGVDENYRFISGVSDNLVNGQYDIGTADLPKLIVGVGVEGALGIRADMNAFSLKIYLPRKGSTEQINLLEDISSDTIRSSAAFMIQQDFDNKYGITNLEFVKNSLRMAPDEFGGIEIAVTDPDNTNAFRSEVRKIFGEGYVVLNKYQQNSSLYSVMNMERWVIYGVLCLILIIAAFTMIGSLTMLVLEKQKDISVLNAMGASRKFIEKIFLTEGMLLATIGGVIGMVLALLIAYLQVQYKLVPLEGGSFLIDHFPVKLRIWDFVLVGTTVFVIAFIASWVPARKASRQEFSLRSE